MEHKVNTVTVVGSLGEIRIGLFDGDDRQSRVALESGEGGAVGAGGAGVVDWCLVLGVGEMPLLNTRQ